MSESLILKEVGGGLLDTCPWVPRPLYFFALQGANKEAEARREEEKEGVAYVSP